MKKKFQIEVPEGVDKVLLHTCCAPCSSAIIECLMQHDITPVIYYCNPNIYPLEEYNIRKEECTRYALSLGLEIIDADYNHEEWLCQMKGMENEPERGGRCLRCFKMRLKDTAKYAHEKGFKVIIVPETATELMSSGIVVPEIGMEAFNNILIERAINKEETTREALKYINSSLDNPMDLTLSSLLILELFEFS